MIVYSDLLSIFPNSSDKILNSDKELFLKIFSISFSDSRSATVQKLALVHYIDEQHKEILDCTKKIFAKTIMPAVGTCLKI